MSHALGYFQDSIFKMTGHRCFLFLTLTWLCAYAITAAPLNSPPPLSLTLLSNLNRTTSSPTLQHKNNTRPLVGTPFPPLPDLPEHFLYEIPYSDPPMGLVFDHFTYHPTTNGTESEKVFQLAIQDALSPEHRPDKLMQLNRVYRYNYGFQALVLVPEDPVGPFLEGQLTYGLWTTALTGLIVFRRAYPGLDFVYEIYTDIGEGQEEFLLGWGLFLFEK